MTKTFTADNNAVPAPNAQEGKLGTFGGVYTPSILTILGVNAPPLWLGSGQCGLTWHNVNCYPVHLNYLPYWFIDLGDRY